MDQIERQSLKMTLSQFTKSLFLKKRTQFLLSVSVFSLLLSNSSRLPFLHSLNFYFSTFPIQLFRHSVDKNCVFLLCNGLLVFVAKFSGLINSSSKTHRTSTHESFKNIYENDEATLVLDSRAQLLEKEASLEKIDSTRENVVVKEARDINEYMIGDLEDGGMEKMIVEDEELEEQKNGFLIDADKEEQEIDVFVQEEAEELDHELLAEEEDEEDYEEGNGVLSTEDLNKKFDEYIRRMKEKIRIEAQQQLVMVK